MLCVQSENACVFFEVVCVCFVLLYQFFFWFFVCPNVPPYQDINLVLQYILQLTLPVRLFQNRFADVPTEASAHTVTVSYTSQLKSTFNTFTN